MPILIVDDNLMIRKTLSRLISKFTDEELIAAKDGLEALQFTSDRLKNKGECFKLIITDIDMGSPEKDGDTFIQNVRQAETVYGVKKVIIYIQSANANENSETFEKNVTLSIKNGDYQGSLGKQASADAIQKILIQAGVSLKSNEKAQNPSIDPTGKAEIFSPTDPNRVFINSSAKRKVEAENDRESLKRSKSGEFGELKFNH